jgi:hypothetical protein
VFDYGSDKEVQERNWLSFGIFGTHGTLAIEQRIALVQGK